MRKIGPKETYEEKLAKNRKYQREHPGRYRATSLAWRIENVDRIMWKDAEKRAKRFGLPFDLELFDIHVPTHCPVLGIPLSYGVGKRTANSPSLDRVDHTRGYTYDNVCVISWRANDLKANGTLEEFKQLVVWLETK